MIIKLISFMNDITIKCFDGDYKIMTNTQDLGLKRWIWMKKPDWSESEIISTGSLFKISDSKKINMISRKRKRILLRSLFENLRKAT